MALPPNEIPQTSIQLIETYFNFSLEQIRRNPEKFSLSSQNVTTIHDMCINLLQTDFWTNLVFLQHKQSVPLNDPQKMKIFMDTASSLRKYSSRR